MIPRGRIAAAALGSEPVATLARSLLRGLRVLAYHNVDDRAAFAAHVDHLVRNYRPVSSDDVVSAVRRGTPLPARAVWVTFDDGSPSVVENALPELAARRLQGTMFVCPGVVDTTVPYWWQVVELAVRHGVTTGLGAARPGPNPATPLKSLPDDERRRVVDDLAGRLRAIGIEPEAPQLTTDELRTWSDAGQSVGNHTWDHPCLDRCSPEEQRVQISRAHEALSAFQPVELFAYPNGNWSAAAEATLEELGYSIGVVFDHRLASLRNPLRMSRLRIDAHASLSRLRAVVSGAHPLLYRTIRRGR